MTEVFEGARLTIDADVDGDGETEVGVFEMLADFEITPSVEQGFLTGGRGADVWSLITDILDVDDVAARKGAYIDLGDGLHTVEISFRGFEGATARDGTPLQWGDGSSDPTDPTDVTKADATGCDPMTQINCLEQYAATGTVDSRNTAVLEYGQRHDGGVYDPMPVVLDGPTLDRAAEDQSWFDGTITAISAIDFQDAIDALSNDLR